MSDDSSTKPPCEWPIKNTNLRWTKSEFDMECDGCGKTLEPGLIALSGIYSCCGGGCERNLCIDCVKRAYWQRSHMILAQEDVDE